MSQPRLEPAVAFGPPPNPPATLPRRAQRALLMGVQDPNNMGSLLRTGLAMGIDTVFLLPGTPGKSGLKHFLFHSFFNQTRTHTLYRSMKRFRASVKYFLWHTSCVPCALGEVRGDACHCVLCLHAYRLNSKHTNKNKAISLSPFL